AVAPDCRTVARPGILPRRRRGRHGERAVRHDYCDPGDRAAAVRARPCTRARGGAADRAVRRRHGRPAARERRGRHGRGQEGRQAGLGAGRPARGAARGAGGPRPPRTRGRARAQRDDAGGARSRGTRRAAAGVRRPRRGARQPDAPRRGNLAVTAPEFSRPIDARHLPTAPLALSASAEERAALAARFGLVSIDRLEAEVTLTPDGEAVAASGRLRAAIVQSCAVSGEDLPVEIDEPIALRFVPSAPVTEEEVELEADELDEIEFDDHGFDLGEAVAQTLALAIDPYAVGPDAEKVRKEAGLLDEGAAGPFAALAALQQDRSEE